MRKTERVASQVEHPKTHNIPGILGDKKGNAAIEFALIAPLFALIFVAGLDLGMVVFSRFKLEGAVSTSSSYAIAHSDQINSKHGGELAKKIALMFTNVYQSGVTAAVEINNGPRAIYDGNKIILGGAANKADACYCPAQNGGSIEWGSPLNCNSSCADGRHAGKYLAIAIKKAHAPFFKVFDVVSDGFIAASAVAQTE